MNFRNFFYSPDASKEKLEIKNDLFNHLVKSRRQKENDIVILKNLKDDFDYSYKIQSVQNKKAFLVLESREEVKNENQNNFHLGFCIIDPKSIKEVLPYLNQTGVEKITFIYSDLSQKSFKLKKEKLQKILINSCEQCGRGSLMKLDFKNSLDDFLKENPNSFVLNFGGQNINEIDIKNIKACVIGPEGGLSEREMKLFEKEKILSFKTSNVLKAENAALCLCSKILL
ncbi:16S rRNA (uracil(1498)-N(3))-methyltransferase [Candidatus Campbellbacteria bacterium]|nr:MAG: 16S rRNA (uracil(1498)-N(3))-methyltransferase [Candidatus Campbellbacteria bacterium]